MKRIVAKVGSSTLTDAEGRLDQRYIRELAGQISELRRRGAEVALVTSGSLRAGEQAIGLDRHRASIPQKQAIAAVGQGLLMHAYHEAFRDHGNEVGQVLLTRDDMADRRRYLNARNTLLALFELGVVPIINENDTLTVGGVVDEIKFGDNDNLAALIAMLIEADLVVLLTDVEGFYRGIHGESPELIPVINKITDEIMEMACGPGGPAGTGGMVTKLEAARIANRSGIPLIICRGRRENVLLDIYEGVPVGTRFEPRKVRRLTGRKRWIAFGSRVRGKLIVNEGAKKAIVHGGKSLLPAGIEAIVGSFRAGDLVSIVGEDGREFARGLANYSAAELDAIRGIQTWEIEKVLGYRGFDEVVHRDNLVVGL